MAGARDKGVPDVSEPKAKAAKGGTDAVGDRLNDVLTRQRAAFLADLPVSAARRIDRIDRAIALLVDHGEALARAMAEDFSARPEAMSLFTDIAPSVKALRHARKHLRAWMRPERRRLDFPLGLLGARGRVEFQPKGTVGLISPWNFPVNLTFAPLAGILAAGNRAMIKPSEITPATSELMARLIGEAFDATEIAVFTGGPEVGEAFAALAFDHLMFTGATSVGRHVMRAAAEHLTPLTLELGGKSPAVLSRSADFGDAASRLVTGKLLNAGQICLAPDYLLVPDDRVDEAERALYEAAIRLYPDILDNPAATAIVNARHRARLEAHVLDARRKGARVTLANPSRDAEAGGNANIMPLHLLREVDESMSVMQEEIFGPLLPLLPYGDIEGAIAFINRRPRPLGLYYFGHDAGEERRLLDGTVSGGVTINDTLWHVAHETLPFGGIGPSGMGVYHGRDGFRAFSHMKAVYRQSRFDINRLIGALPPYGKRLQRILATEIRK